MNEQDNEIYDLINSERTKKENDPIFSCLLSVTQYYQQTETLDKYCRCDCEQNNNGIARTF